MVDFSEYFGDVNGGKILDVGCRYGEFGERLAKVCPGCSVVGIDNIRKTVDEAKEKKAGSGIEFICMDGRNMDFPDESFEIVAVSNTLHHMKDYETVFSEMLRVLKKGGYFVVNEMYRGGEQNEAQKVHEAQHTWEAKLDMLLGKYQIQVYTEDELRKIFDRLPLHDTKYIKFEEEEKYDKKLAEKNAKLLESVEKIASDPHYAEMKKEAAEIVELCKKYGIKRGTQLMFIGKK